MIPDIKISIPAIFVLWCVAAYYACERSPVMLIVNSLPSANAGDDFGPLP